MNIKMFNLGPLETNCYLFWENSVAYLFDCGGSNLNSVERFLKENNLNLKYLVLTHGHYDHIGGMNKLIEMYPSIEVFISDEESIFLHDSRYSLSSMIDGSNFTFKGEYKKIKDGDMVGDFLAIYTPGHTAGSMCFYNKENKLVITGDTMFKNSFGRTDLPTGNEMELYRSLNRLCEVLPEDTKVYNAHMDVTTIGSEKKFLKMMGIIR